MPKVAARQTKFARAQLNVRIHATVAQTAEQTDLRLTVLAPRYVPTFCGPQHVFVERAVQQQVNGVESDGGVGVGAENPRRLRAPNADVLRVILKQVDVPVLTNLPVNLRWHDVRAQAAKLFCEFEREQFA